MANLHPLPSHGDRTDDVSLFRGGLFYRAQCYVHLLGPDRWNLGPRLALTIGLVWLPLVVLTFLFTRDQLPGLLRSYAVYARLVVATPVLLFGQMLMDNRSAAILTHVRRKRLLDGEDEARLNAAIAQQRRWRDSIYPELVIAILVYALEVGMLLRGTWESRAPAWAAAQNPGPPHLTPAGVYFALVSVPVYQFLLALNFWKWLVWSYLLIRLSGTKLKLMATHPDGHGGLGFLSLSAAGFTPIAFAVSTAIGADWRDSILLHGATLEAFRLPAITLFVVMFLVALAPLIFFVPRLAVLRHRAMLEYSTLGQLRVGAFEERWLRARDTNQDPFAPEEISALAHLTAAYSNLKRMQPLPADLNTLIGLAVAIALPLVPVVLAQIPLSVILKSLMVAAKAVPI